MKLDMIPLEGRLLSLHPATESDRDPLGSVLDCDYEHWKILPRCGLPTHFAAYWAAINAPGRAPYIACLATGKEIIGTSSFIGIDPVNETVEIGATWFLPEQRGGGVNTEAKLLMLTHAFASGARRVQFTVDARNGRSRRAVSKLGAKEEGTLRSNLLTWTGHRRDTVVYSILDGEWPDIRVQLLDRLAES